jgi:tRNA U34 5-carboxymethylaminomethyl modifying GTPase MnmE/TrmE
MSDQIFEDKTFQDLTKDIYDNAVEKKKQIQILIREMNKMIKSIDDIVLLAPIIKEYLEVGVKNDEHLVKLASVLQRIITKSSSSEETQFLSETEKQDLMESLQNTVEGMQQEADKIQQLKTGK